MSPEQISALTAIAAIIEKVGTWPIGTIVLLVVLGPWVFAYLMNSKHEQRFAAVVKMYESNVQLVKDNEDLTKSYEKIVGEQADTIRLSTAATTELTTYLKNQVPCYARIKDMQPRGK
jgi:hypothetical protein